MCFIRSRGKRQIDLLINQKSKSLADLEDVFKYKLYISLKLMYSLYMEKGEFLSTLLRSSKTVFSLTDMALLWESSVTNAVRVRVNYYVRTGELVHLHKGLYAKDKNYNPLELATKIYLPSYVSFETVLAKAGIIFQFYNEIFAASYLTRQVTVDGRLYTFRKIKDVVLTNPLGLENQDHCSIASPERALLDTMYLNQHYHFDNLAPIQWDKVFQILPIYKNKSMENRIQKLHNISHHQEI